MLYVEKIESFANVLWPDSCSAQVQNKGGWGNTIGYNISLYGFPIMRNMYAYDGRFQLQAWKQWLIKNVKNVKQCEKSLKIQLGRWNSDFFFFRFDFFGFQFCCSYFAACPTSAGWKSERSSSNRSEVDCADRRSVKFSYSKTMTTRSKTQENKTSKLL